MTGSCCYIAVCTLASLPWFFSPLFDSTFGTQSGAHGFWDSGVKTIFFYIYPLPPLPHWKTLLLLNKWWQIEIPECNILSTLLKRSVKVHLPISLSLTVLEFVVLSYSILETGHLLVRGALLFWTAWQQGDLWSAGLSMLCCFLLCPATGNESCIGTMMMALPWLLTVWKTDLFIQSRPTLSFLYLLRKSVCFCRH